MTILLAGERYSAHLFLDRCDFCSQEAEGILILLDGNAKQLFICVGCWLKITGAAALSSARSS